jgi:parvulin-like peptidyl-prolyl isomerase
MRTRTCLWLTALVLAVAAAPLAAQTTELPKLPEKQSEATGVAAVVNNQEISERAVRRLLQFKLVPPSKYSVERPPVLDYLIENALIDQYLVRLKVNIDLKDVNSHLQQMYEEAKKNGGDSQKLLKDLMMTEEELKAEIEPSLRWEKFITEQMTDEKLKKFFEANKDAFDGTQVRARHILIKVAPGDEAAGKQAVADLQAMRKQIEDSVAAAVAKLPLTADALDKEKAKAEALAATFSDLAREKSNCPSKERGGELDWFPRVDGMIEPFARAAFALKPNQLSDVVKSQFGYHLILVTDRKPGKEVKFEDAKPAVKEFYDKRLREAVVTAMKPGAKIQINEVK